MPYEFPRCQVIPEADHQVSLQIDGRERLRWHFGAQYPRPFFYPMRGPSGAGLTRMGHPGAPNHDHHESIWFAHNKVLGIDFWSNNSPAYIRQKEWIAYQDGNEEAFMAVNLGWYDGHDPRELLSQQLVAALIPGENGETMLELQSTFTPTSADLELQQTNFGFLAVRMAKSLSAYFGGGEITSSEGARGEPEIFGKPARWMDYSGPVPGGISEGITYFDHPANPGHPAKWHVREDGWMGASLCRDGAILLHRDSPLIIRYLLHAHSGPADAKKANSIAKEFANRPAMALTKGTLRHTNAVVERKR